MWSTLFTSILKVSNVRQLFAADDISRRHFSDAFFLGVLRVKLTHLPVEVMYVKTVYKNDIN